MKAIRSLLVSNTAILMSFEQQTRIQTKQFSSTP